MSEIRDHFAGKRVFVTGHTGFKGSWLSLWLAQMGAQVHGYARTPPTRPSLFDEAGIAGLLASHTLGDVRDAASLATAVRNAKPEIVVHLAAQPLVRRSYAEPRETFETNVMGTVNLLEAVRQADTVRVCLVVTTDKCYENREWVFPYRENDPMGGFDPYSASKGCMELAVSAWRRSFFFPEEIAKHGVSLSSARAGNVIGGGDWAEDRIIPDCIRYLEKGESILVRNPAAIRPWQHVLEPLSGYLLLAACQLQRPAVFADAFNFGPLASGNATVREIAERVIAGWGAGRWHTLAEETAKPRDPLHEANYLKLDATKAISLLGWMPQYDVAAAVQKTAQWYRRRHDAGPQFAAAALCAQQISDYEKAMGSR